MTLLQTPPDSNDAAIEGLITHFQKGGDVYWPMSVEDVTEFVALQVKLTAVGANQSRLSPEDERRLVELRRTYDCTAAIDHNDEPPRFRS